jgi:hypothetical protein
MFLQTDLQQGLKVHKAEDQFHQEAHPVLDKEMFLQQTPFHHLLKLSTLIQILL